MVEDLGDVANALGALELITRPAAFPLESLSSGAFATDRVARITRR